MKTIGSVSMSVLTVLFLAISCFGQAGGEASSGRISGRVIDPSGAVAPGVTVEALNVGTGVRHTMETNSEGLFTFLQLINGTYTVTATKQGFKKFEQTGILLVAGKRVDLEIAFQLGTTSETVTVTGRASTVDTSSTSVGMTRVNKEIHNLPIQSTASRGRMIQSVLATYPGNVYRVAAYGEALLFAYDSTMNGSNSSYNTFEVDGASGAVNLGTPAAGNTGIQPDVVDEIRVEANPNAEYGTNLGNHLAIVTKSGTNTWHGSVYQYYMSGKWASAPWTNNANPALAQSRKRNLFQQNEPGFAAGGPIIKDRLFVFGSYDWHHNLSVPNQGISTIPTSKMQAGDFSELIRPTGACTTPPCNIGTDILGRPIFFGEIYDPSTNRAVTVGQVDPVSGLVATASGNIRDGFGFDPATGLGTATANIIPPGQLSPASLIFEDAIPASNLGPAGALVSNALYAPRAGGGNNLRRFSARADAVLGAHRIGFFVWFVEPYDVLNACVSGWANVAPPVIGCIISPRHDRRWRVSDSYTVSPNVLWEGSFTRNWQQSFVGVCCEGATFGKTMGLQGFASDNTPFVFTQNYGIMGYHIGSDDNTGGTWNIASSLSWIKGKHSFKFGGIYEHAFSHALNDTLSGGQMNFGSAESGLPGYSGTGWDFASLMLGKVGTISAAIPGSENFSHAGQYGFYGQDSWRITPKLTANYGLRWDIGVPGGDCRTSFSTFDPTVPNPGAGGNLGALKFYGPNADTSKCATKDINWTTIGPRLGLAYAFTPKTMVRLYYGINYSPNFGGGLNFQETFTRQGAFGSQDGGFTAAYDWDIPFDNIAPNGSFIIPPSASTATNPAQNNGGGAGWVQWDDNRAAMSQSLGFGVERQLPFGIIGKADYVGKLIHGLPASWEYNAIPLKFYPLGATLNTPMTTCIADPTCTAQLTAAGARTTLPFPTFTSTVGNAQRPYPQYTSVSSGSPSGYSTYHAIQVTAQKHVGGGLSFLGGFTFGKYILLGPFQHPELRSTGKTIGFPDNGTDRPRSVNISYLYELPFGRGKHFVSSANRVVNQIVSGWQVSGIHQYFSGQTIRVTSNTGFWPIRNNGVPVLNANGCQGYQYSATFDPTNPAQRYLNPGSFSSPVGSFVLGNTNAVADARNCGVNLEFLSLAKNTHLTERFSFNAGVDVFNAFNRHAWGIPDSNVDSPSFGRITGTSGTEPRRVQVWMRFEF